MRHWIQKDKMVVKVMEKMVVAEVVKVMATVMEEMVVAEVVEGTKV